MSVKQYGYVLILSLTLVLVFIIIYRVPTQSTIDETPRLETRSYTTPQFSN